MVILQTHSRIFSIVVFGVIFLCGSLVATIDFDLSLLNLQLEALEKALPALAMANEETAESRRVLPAGEIITYENNIQQAMKTEQPINLFIAANLPEKVKTKKQEPRRADGSYPMPTVVFENFDETLNIFADKIEQLLKRNNPRLATTIMHPKYLQIAALPDQQKKDLKTIMAALENVAHELSQNYNDNGKMTTLFQDLGPIDDLQLSALEIIDQDVNFVVNSKRLKKFRSQLLSSLITIIGASVTKINPEEISFHFPIVHTSGIFVQMPEVPINRYTTKGWMESWVPMTAFDRWGSVTIDRQTFFKTPSVTLYWQRSDHLDIPLITYKFT